MNRGNGRLLALYVSTVDLCLNAKRLLLFVALMFVTLLIKGLTRWLLTTMIIVEEEAEAKNFVLYIGHLRGEGSHWCNRLPLRK
jgi:hypothetical protein